MFYPMNANTKKNEASPKGPRTTMSEFELSARVAYSEIRAGNRENANDTLAEDGIKREARKRIMFILDSNLSEDDAIAFCKEQGLLDGGAR
jgi:hypothetical protein